MKINIKQKLLCLFLAQVLIGHSQICSERDINSVSRECNDNGYCIGTQSHFGCACNQGYIGHDCSLNQMGSCTPHQVLPFKSDFETEVYLQMNGDFMDVTVETVLENTVEVDDKNYARWTRIFFSDGDSRDCGYPESSYWEKSISEDCREVYTHSYYFSETSSCFELRCLDSNDEVVQCDRSACLSPPCKKVYRALMTVERSYEKTNGRLHEIVSSSTQNELLVERPWIEAVNSADSPFRIEIVTPTLVENDIQLLSADYETAGDSWSIRLSSLVLHPWKLESQDLFQFGGINATISQCDIGVDHCIQIIEITAAGCDAFTMERNLLASGLTYACNTVSTADCPKPEKMPTELSIFVSATSPCTIQPK